MHAVLAERGCSEGVTACALGDSTSVDGGLDGDRADTAPPLLDAAVADGPRRNPHVQTRHSTVRDREYSCVLR